MNTIRAAFAAVLLCLPLLAQVPLPQSRDQAGAGDFDIRDALRTRDPDAKESAQSLRSMRGTRARMTRNGAGRVTSMIGESSALSVPSTRGREQIVRDFLGRETDAFSFLPQGRDRLRLVLTDDSTGLSVLRFQQNVAGIPVFEGTLKAALNHKGELIRVDTGNLLPDMSINTTPLISGAQAIASAYRLSNLTIPGEISPRPSSRDGRVFYQIADGPEVPVETVVFPLTASRARLAYRIFVDAGPDTYYEIVVNARDGSLLLRHNLVRKAGQARVWKESPLSGARELVTFAEGWMPADGVLSTGNNADVYVDANGDGSADSDQITGLRNGRAVSEGQVFDFLAPEGIQQDPRQFKPASVANLFYLVNAAHDYYYSLGFTEAAGNFQTNNLGRGGSSSDAVVVRAQSGATNDNASFATLPDGLPGIMRVGIFRNSTISNLSDDRDSGFDGTVILHEYGHGVSSRLVGGPTGTTCLRGIQSGAMGEGWSDYFAASYYNNPIIGEYVTQRNSGFRRQNYTGYKLTYEDLGNESYEVHRDGEIWAAALWDLRNTLGAPVTTDRLVVAGLKLTPCNPSMVSARDAILQADQALNEGANVAAIWRVFARHGLGFSARGSDAPLRASRMVYANFYLAAFDLPANQQTGNKPPVITSAAPPTVAAGSAFTYQVVATDPDGGTLSYEITSGPPTLTISPSGLLQGVPEFTSQRMKITVSDGQGGRVVLGFVLSVETPLVPGGTLDIRGALGSAGFATLSVPANTLVFQVSARGAIGDPDLFVFDPDGLLVASAFRTGTDEVLSISAPKAGRWTIGVQGYQRYAGTTLTAEFPVPKTLTSATPVTIDGAIGSETIWKLTVPPGANSLSVQTSGGTGDLDLFLKRGQVPACQSIGLPFGAYCIFDARSLRLGNTESVVVPNPGAGDWYIAASANLAYAGVTLTGTYTFPTGLRLSASELVFNAVQGGASPAAQSFVVSHTDSSVQPFSWTATTTTNPAGSWLRLGSANGQNGESVAVSVVTTGLGVGTYRGTVTVTAPGVENSPRSVAVTVTIAAPPPPVGPRFATPGVINGATFLPGISPGSWFTIRGTLLAQTTRIWQGSDFKGTGLPTALDGVSVKVNGKDALVYYISDTQINALAPDDDFSGSAQVTITNRLGSATTTALVSKVAPGFFMFDPQNRRYVAAVHPDGALAGPEGLFGATAAVRPLAVGGRIQLFATGFGATDPPAPAAEILAAPLPLPASANLRITIGGAPATVEFAGMISNGLYQFNVVVPELPDGDHAIVAEVDGGRSASGAFVNLKTPPPPAL